VEKNSYLKCGSKKWRKTHTSSEAQKSGKKLTPQVRHRRKIGKNREKYGKIGKREKGKGKKREEKGGKN
jgi:hypothetical protein